MKRSTVVAAVLLLAGALPGCGDDDNGGGGGGGGASKEDYAAKADEICAKANDQENAIGLPRPGDRESPKYKDASFRKKFVSIGNQAVADLRALEPPEGEEERADAMVSSLETVYSSWERFMKAEVTGNGTASNKAVRNYDLAYTDVGAAAASLGVTSCVGLGN